MGKKNVEETKEELIELRRKWYRKGNFDINTMSDVEKRAQKAKILVAAHGEHHEIIGRFNEAIKISKDYHDRHAGLENETIREALREFEYGVELFLHKV